MEHAIDLALGYLYGGGAVALIGAFVWGVFSVILSPCGIAMLPLVVGYIENSDTPDTWAAFRISFMFCVGVIVNLLLVGALVVSVGAAFGGHEVWLTLIVGVIFIVIGLHLMGVLRIPWLLGGNIKETKYGGLKGALILGVLSGLALGPCSFAYATPILSIAALAAREHDIVRASSILLCYALGYSLVLIMAGTGAKWLSRFFSWKHGGAALKVLNFICGLALVAGGIYFIYNAPVWTLLHF